QPVQHPRGRAAADPRRRHVPRHGTLGDQRGRQFDRDRRRRQVGGRIAARARGQGGSARHRSGAARSRGVRVTVRARRPDAEARRGALRFGRIARWLLIAAAAVVAIPAAAQQEDSPTTLTGTLRKARETGAITLAYRASSIPFSYLSPRGEPIGYSIDLCKLLVDAIGEEVGRSLEIKWQPVTPESRIGSIASGQSDLECGSTTSNLERRKLVAFSPTIFVSGTKLLVRKGSPIRSFRDLGGKKVVVTAGTTNEAAMREIARKFKLDFALLTAADHAASFAMLTAGE